MIDPVAVAYFAIFGFFGGVIRALIGLMKVERLTLHFQWKYFVFTTVVSGVIGMFAGMLAGSDFRVAMLAGYAGIDMIEGLYRAQKAHFGK